MKREEFDIYHLTEEREKTLWKDCLFIFDSSALLDFYYYPETTRQEIYTDIFEKIKGRLWIPNHIQFEFLKNRLSIIKKPISENYQPLIDNILKPVLDSVTQTKKNLQDLRQRTKNKDKHPFIEPVNIDEFDKHLEMYTEKLKEFNEKYLAQIKDKQKEINDLELDDSVLKNMENYFPVGREFSFSEIIEITKEGKHRFEFDIPPGYEDLKKEKKEGTQIFGDLIIWRQILDHARKEKKDVVFISNDLKKDWCELEATEKRIKNPRLELIKEFKDETTKDFWMYNSAQFLYASKKLLKTKITEEQIELVSDLITARSRDDFFTFQCHECMSEYTVNVDDFSLEYDCVDGSERQMGPENHYEATQDFQCPNCKNWISAIFNIWEYPVGAINYTEIELDGAELLKSCELYIDLHETPDDFLDEEENEGESPSPR
ncbi:MAG: hypothetical protein HOP30_11565 [Cyclobacteriaceae bacterium]|nr:hypothetical protein [Cyclobacteriaceae bacterium]